MCQTSACNRCWMSSSSSSGRSAKVRKCWSQVEVPTCTLRWWQWPSLQICEHLWTSAHLDIDVMTSWTSVTICEGLWTPLNICEHMWPSLTICEHLWTSVNNCEHEWSSVNIYDQWSLTIFEHMWTSLNIWENVSEYRWKSLNSSEHQLIYVKIYVDSCGHLKTSCHMSLSSLRMGLKLGTKKDLFTESIRHLCVSAE